MIDSDYELGWRNRTNINMIDLIKGVYKGERLLQDGSEFIGIKVTMLGTRTASAFINH